MGGRQDTGGLSTALQLLGAAGVVDDDGGEQAELFEAPAPLPLPMAPAADGGKAGRPKGARNKSTDEWVRFFLGRYRSPLTGLAELYTRPLEELVDQLQAMADKHAEVKTRRAGADAEATYDVHVARINPLEVLKMQRDAMVAILPYVHKRQPLEVAMDVRQRGIVVLGELGELAPNGDDDLALPLAPTVQNQQVIDAVPTQSDEHKSEMQHDQRDGSNGV